MDGYNREYLRCKDQINNCLAHALAFLSAGDLSEARNEISTADKLITHLVALREQETA